MSCSDQGGCRMDSQDDPREDAIATGYSVLQFQLPALNTFSKALCSGHEPEELQLLYRAWTAGPQQQVRRTILSLLLHLDCEAATCLDGVVTKRSLACPTEPYCAASIWQEDC